MTDSLTRPSPVVYPDTDGLPLCESDPTRDYLLYSVATLESFFKGRPNTYVSGNLFIYYKEGDPSSVISPDVFVIFGVSKCKRRSYQAWKEGGKLPAFILEVTSRSTKRQDELEKPKLYAQLGVTEYFQYDPTGDYLQPQLKGQRLIQGEYQPLPLQTRANGIHYIHSETLGLDLCLRDPNWQGLMVSPEAAARSLRFFDPQTQSWLLSYEELDHSRLQTEQEKVQLEQEKVQIEQERDQARQSLRQAAQQLAALGMPPDEIATLLQLDPQDLR